MAKTSGQEELEASGGIYQMLAAVQEKIAFLPDYSFKVQERETSAGAGEADGAWPAVDAGTSISGLVGGAMTLLLAGMIGFGINLIKKRKKTVLFKEKSRRGSTPRPN